MSATKVEVGAISGVDLSADGWVREARRRRALAAFAERVEEENERLLRRASWLQRKVARLPLNSNGRSSALTEASDCETLADLLPRAQRGEPTPKFKVPGRRHLCRAVRLLHSLQSAG